MTRKRMPSLLISSGVAGAIALVIYAELIYAIFGAVNAASAGSIAIGAVLLGLFTFVVAFVIISSYYARRRRKP